MMCMVGVCRAPAFCLGGFLLLLLVGELARALAGSVPEGSAAAALQWKEGAADRTEEGKRRQAAAHEARLEREAAAKAAEAKAAFADAQKNIAAASNRKAPALTVADVAGIQ